MELIRAGALLVGSLALGFFAIFAGYYLRNRRLALEARRLREDERAGSMGE